MATAVAETAPNPSSMARSLSKYMALEDSDAEDSETDMYALYKLRQRELEFVKIQVCGPCFPQPHVPPSPARHVHACTHLLPLISTHRVTKFGAQSPSHCMFHTGIACGCRMYGSVPCCLVRF